MDVAQHYVVDVRDSGDYAAGHVPNSVNIGLAGFSQH
ncbi:MAG: rhodanese-like domain-containing protein [Desulfobacterales bacterium]